MEDVVNELAEKQQRIKFLEKMIEHRVAHLDYLKRMYEYQSTIEGRKCKVWLNVANVDPVELYSQLDDTTKRKR